MNGHGELLDRSRCEFFRHFRVRCCWKGDEDSDELSEAAVFFCPSKFLVSGKDKKKRKQDFRVSSDDMFWTPSFQLIQIS